MPVSDRHITDVEVANYAKNNDPVAAFLQSFGLGLRATAEINSNRQREIAHLSALQQHQVKQQNHLAEQQQQDDHFYAQQGNMMERHRLEQGLREQQESGRMTRENYKIQNEIHKEWQKADLLNKLQGGDGVPKPKALASFRQGDLSSAGTSGGGGHASSGGSGGGHSGPMRQGMFDKRARNEIPNFNQFRRDNNVYSWDHDWSGNKDEVFVVVGKNGTEKEAAALARGIVEKYGGKLRGNGVVRRSDNGRGLSNVNHVEMGHNVLSRVQEDPSHIGSIVNQTLGSNQKNVVIAPHNAPGKKAFGSPGQGANGPSGVSEYDFYQNVVFPSAQNHQGQSQQSAAGGAGLSLPTEDVQDFGDFGTWAPNQGKVRMTNYGYRDDTNFDPNDPLTADEQKNIDLWNHNSNVLAKGNRDNKLVPGVSAAINPSYAAELGAKFGDTLELTDDKGNTRYVTYDDTAAPEAAVRKMGGRVIDIFRPKTGNNTWGGHLKSVKVVGSHGTGEGFEGQASQSYKNFLRYADPKKLPSLQNPSSQNQAAQIEAMPSPDMTEVQSQLQKTGATQEMIRLQGFKAQAAQAGLGDEWQDMYDTEAAKPQNASVFRKMEAQGQLDSLAISDDEFKRMTPTRQWQINRLKQGHAMPEDIYNEFNSGEDLFNPEHAQRKELPLSLQNNFFEGTMPPEQFKHLEESGEYRMPPVKATAHEPEPAVEEAEPTLLEKVGDGFKSAAGIVGAIRPSTQPPTPPANQPPAQTVQPAPAFQEMIQPSAPIAATPEQPATPVAATQATPVVPAVEPTPIIPPVQPEPAAPVATPEQPATTTSSLADLLTRGSQ